MSLSYDTLKRCAYAAMYGAGDIAIAKLCGQYPPPDFIAGHFQLIGRGMRIPTFSTVLDTALKLPRHNRESLIEALIDSLDDEDGDIEADMCDLEDTHDAEDTGDDDEDNGDREQDAVDAEPDCTI